MTVMNIGFIGLGAMGEPMCEHILAAGHRVYSCANQNRGPIERLKQKGLIEKENSGQVGTESDVLFTVVWDEAQNDKVLRGESGALAALKPGSTIVLMSTISPAYCRELAEKAAKSGVNVLDCPVSGLASGARAATLSLMVGGEDSVIEHCRPILETMGTVLKCGPLGTGQAVKLGNNAIVLGSYQLIQEVRDTVAAEGVELENFMAILNQSTGRSFVSENFPMPKTRQPLRAMPEKDISRCLEVADAKGVKMPMLSACYQSGTE